MTRRLLPVISIALAISLTSLAFLTLGQPGPAQSLTATSGIEVDLWPGWNLVGVSSEVRLTGDAPPVMLAENAGSRAWYYWPSDGRYYGTNTLHPGSGYWVVSNVRQKWNVDEQNEDVVIHLAKGLNLISVPIETSVAEFEKQAKLTGLEGQKAWYYYPPDSKYYESSTLRPGFGYWVGSEEQQTVRIGFVPKPTPLPPTPTPTAAPRPTATPPFPTPTAAPPQPPVPSSPASGDSLTNAFPTLEWKPSLNASSYDVQIAVDSAFTALVVDRKSVTAPRLTVTAGTLNWTTSYFWRVRANGSGTPSTWSDAWTFVTPSQPKAVPIVFNVRGGDGTIYNLYTTDPGGSGLKRLTEGYSRDSHPRWSPDHSRIAYASRDAGLGGSPQFLETYVMDADGRNVVRLTRNNDADDFPSWSPDGSRIVFTSWRDGNGDIYTMNGNGGDVKRITSRTGADRYPAFSPDGSRIVFASERDGNEQVYMMNADGSNQVRLSNNRATDTAPDFSPDGTRIVFSSNRDGNWEIYVMNADGTEQRNLTNNSSFDMNPSWSPEGTQIVFVSYRDNPLDPQVYSMNADGTDVERITPSIGGCYEPDW